METVKAIWLKFHPLSACSVGDIEEIPQDRFKTLEQGKYVAQILGEETPPKPPKPTQRTEDIKK